jgi:hypothetical protein
MFLAPQRERIVGVRKVANGVEGLAVGGNESLPLRGSNLDLRRLTAARE